MGGDGQGAEAGEEREEDEQSGKNDDTEEKTREQTHRRTDPEGRRVGGKVKKVEGLRSTSA